MAAITVEPVAIAPLAEQHKIVAEFERLVSIIDALEQILDLALKQAQRVRRSILKDAFAGTLVPQDPNDEPAERLLERIKTERAKRKAEKQAEAKSNRKRVTRKRLNRPERPAA
jgi:type I restriction enzyme S subunit